MSRVDIRRPIRSLLPLELRNHRRARSYVITRTACCKPFTSRGLPYPSFEREASSSRELEACDPATIWPREGFGYESDTRYSVVMASGEGMCFVSSGCEQLAGAAKRVKISASRLAATALRCCMDGGERGKQEGILKLESNLEIGKNSEKEGKLRRASSAWAVDRAVQLHALVSPQEGAAGTTTLGQDETGRNFFVKLSIEKFFTTQTRSLDQNLPTVQIFLWCQLLLP